MDLSEAADIVEEPCFRDMLENGLDAQVRFSGLESADTFEQIVWRMRFRYRQRVGAALYITFIGINNENERVVEFRLCPPGQSRLNLDGRAEPPMTERE